MSRKFLQKQIKPQFYLVALFGLIALRLSIAWSQRVFLMVEGSGIDDMLMVRAAMSICNGQWLGAYEGMTLGKNMGFALWLALLNTLRIPMLLGNAALWIFASAFAARALRPVFTGNLSRLCLFAFLAFQPVSFAFFTQRAYRDGIYPALCLLLFAGVAGLVLRLGEEGRKGKLLASIGAGAGLTGGWLVREDGMVLLLFALCALLFAAFCLVFTKAAKKKIQNVILCLLPFGMLAIGIVGFSAINYANYGVFVVNDANSGEFPKAYGAMVGVSEAISGKQARRPVSREALEQMLAEVPSLQRIEPYLLEGAAFNGFSNPETKEFAGSFYYALKIAAGYAGETPDGKSAQQYWQQVKDEINAATASGKLPTTGGKTSLVPSFTPEYLPGTVKETGIGFFTVMTFMDCEPRPAESLDLPSIAKPVAEFLHSTIQEGYVAGTSLPYYNLAQRLVFAFCDALIWLYSVAVWPLLFFALAGMIKGFISGISDVVTKKAPMLSLSPLIVLLGLLLSFILRLVVSAYMETASFGIGTYIMYLSGGVPALLLFLGWGSGLAVSGRKGWKQSAGFEKT